MGKQHRLKHRRQTPASIPSKRLPENALKKLQCVMLVTTPRPPAKEHILTADDIRLLADLATNLWRAKQRIVEGKVESEIKPELQKVLRPIQSALENLARLRVEVEDKTGEPYVQGMSFNVVSSQPNSRLASDRICETWKPTVRYDRQIVQLGEIVIEGPTSQPKTI